MSSIKKGFGEYHIKLGHDQYYALKIMCAKFDMTPSQIITMALDNFYRKKLTQREKESIDDKTHCNQIIGELINKNRGVWGYNPTLNPIPKEEEYLLIE